jgi:hypothetical protein
MSDSLLDDLLDDSQTDYLKKSCPSLFDGSGAPKFSYNNILSTDKANIIPDGLKYYKMVETGNNYVNDLLLEEEKYLKEKYGESLYNYFVSRRDEYINSKIKDTCEIVTGSSSSTSSSTSSSSSSSSSDYSSSLIVALRQQLNSYKQSLITYNEVSKQEEKNIESGLLNARKFYYRSDAMKDVDKIDTALSAIYYVVIILCVVYVAIKGRLSIRKNWWVYLLLFILPLILSRIYIFLAIRFQNLKDTVSEQIPKKAFMNQI